MIPVEARTSIPTVDVVIVNWNAGDGLRGALRSVECAQTDTFRLATAVVVDNGSTDDSLADLPSVGGRLAVDRAAQNLGFARGCNRGAQKGSGAYILFLNPDTRIPEDAIARCVAFMEHPANVDVGICGARMVDERGGAAVCAARFPSASTFAFKALGLCALFPRRFPSLTLPPGQPAQSGVVDQVIGAFFFVRRDLFERCRGFDERFFMYFEELDFALRVRKLGFKSYCLTDIEVVHAGGGCTMQVPARRLAYSWRSRLQYARKHFSVAQCWSLAVVTGLVEPVVRVLRAAATSRFEEVPTILRAWWMFVRGVNAPVAHAETGDWPPVKKRSPQRAPLPLADFRLASAAPNANTQCPVSTQMESRSPIVDRAGFLPRIATLSHVELELGCGARKRSAMSIGVDALSLPGVDLVGDVFDVLAALPSASVDRVTSFHFFEHVDDLARLVCELGRVMKPGGELEVVVPHFSNPYFYSDYTHRRAFGLYTFAYLAHTLLFARTVPAYAPQLFFELRDVRLGFKSPRPFYLRYAIKRGLGLLFNATNPLREFWEENLCYVFPCYEIAYSLKRLPKAVNA